MYFQGMATVGGSWEQREYSKAVTEGAIFEIEDNQPFSKSQICMEGKF